MNQIAPPEKLYGLNEPLGLSRNLLHRLAYGIYQFEKFVRNNQGTIITARFGTLTMGEQYRFELTREQISHALRFIESRTGKGTDLCRENGKLLEEKLLEWNAKEPIGRIDINIGRLPGTVPDKVRLQPYLTRRPRDFVPA